MSPIEAIDVLERATSILQANRSDHMLIMEALRTLRESHMEPAPTEPG